MVKKSQTNNLDEPIKRGPGRPSLQGKVDKIPKKGIISKPLYGDDNIVELACDNPIVFHKIFNFLKLMVVSEIKMVFKKTSVQLIATDHLEKSFINLTIECKDIVSYYCNNQIVVNLDLKNIEKVIQKINKFHHLITFISKKDTYNSEIMINFTNIILDSDEIHIINLIDSSFSDNMNIKEKNIDYKNYPIQFQLPFPHFKNIIQHISSFSKIFKVEKLNNVGLQFSYETDGRTIKAMNIFNDSKKIKLISKINENEVFSVSTYVSYIKSLSKSLISKNIKIYLDRNKDMVFKLLTDDMTFDLTVYTEIISF